MVGDLYRPRWKHATAGANFSGGPTLPWGSQKPSGSFHEMEETRILGPRLKTIL